MPWDQVFLSLASSHNAVYRMVDGLRPLLEEFQVNTSGYFVMTIFAYIVRQGVCAGDG